MHNPRRFSPSISDAELLNLTRDGDTSAYGELWRRHFRSGCLVARSLSHLDPEDVVAESFARVLRQMRMGGGPTAAFRSYLMRTIRNTAVAWHRRERTDSTNELDAIPDPKTGPEASWRRVDRHLALEAFELLPLRWQQVLWLTVVEDKSPADVGAVLGLSANSAAALAARAREGLRQAWIQVHLEVPGTASEHRWVRQQLGAYVRGKLSHRNGLRVRWHLLACAACERAEQESRRIEASL